MKIIGIPRINALGNNGPEDMPKAISDDLKMDFEIMNIDNSNIEKSEREILNKSEKEIGAGEKTCFIGGDHSITYPIIKSFKKKYQKPFLIVLDAHPDCMEPMREPTHEEFLRAIIEDGFDPQNIILIGVRKIEPEEKIFLEKSGIKVFGEIRDIEAVADYVTEKALGNDTYLSIDIDVLDPSHAPAVNYPEVNGLTSKEFFYLIRRILKIKTLRAMDIIEAVPQKDKKYDNRTIKTCSKVVEEFINHS